MYVDVVVAASPDGAVAAVGSPVGSRFFTLATRRITVAQQRQPPAFLSFMYVQ